MPHNAVARLTIADGQTKSTSLGAYWGGTGSRAGKVSLDNAIKVTIMSPVAGTVEVAHVKDAADADFKPLRREGSAADVALVANKAIDLSGFSAFDLRVVAGAGVTGAQTVLVSVQEMM